MQLATLKHIYQHFRPAPVHYEQGYVLYLSLSLDLIEFDTLQGTDSHVFFNLTTIMQHCVRNHFTKVITVHTHPYGFPAALSSDDLLLHNDAARYFKQFGIELLDTVVLTWDSYSSFRKDHALTFVH